MKKLLPNLLPILLLLAAVVVYQKCLVKQPAAKTAQPAAPAKTEQKSQPATPAKNRDLAPDYVWQVLEKIKQTGEAPDGYVGGRTFQNRENRLPKTSPDGAKIQYREWDVHPKIQGKNRGAERLVTGDDRSAWFTADHYRNFVRLE